MSVSLRSLLAARRAVVAPGAYDALTARLVEEAGFPVVFLSGAGVSYSRLCRPDIGLVTLSEMADKVAELSSAVDIPVIADGDNGHGNAVNLMRAVELFERAGASAIQLEDQTFPKRCGHLEGKRLISVAEMVGKIRAARAARSSEEFLIIARTDARSVLGLDAALDRARHYADAGADILFVESPTSRDELERIGRELAGKPLVANMVEGGKTPMLSRDELSELGFALVLFPNALTRSFVAAGRRVLGELASTGTTVGVSDAMVTFQDIGELTGLAGLSELEQRFVPKES